MSADKTTPPHPGCWWHMATTVLVLMLLVAPVCVSPEVTKNKAGATKAFFNATENANATLPGTINLKKETIFSFRTCAYGFLVQQTGATGDSLAIAVTPTGGLTMSWKTRYNLEGNVTLSVGSPNGPGLSDNHWYTVDIMYRLGVISLQVESGQTHVADEIVSNSTHRRYLRDLDLSGDNITVGSGFTGCIEQVFGFKFNTPDAEGNNVHWGECPLQAPTVRGCDLQQYNPCYLYPCLNGGTCAANGSDFVCRCPAPFNGNRCQHDLGEEACRLEPCMNNGTCYIHSHINTNIKRFACNCPQGFVGSTCEKNIDECGSLPCQNNGVCNDMDNGFVCNCSSTGYEGPTCEINVNECEANTDLCKNGGECLNTPGNYKCNCVPGYGGLTCEIELKECSSNPCMNNANCTDKLAAYICTCATGFTGADCETNIDDCVGNPCVHPHHCVDGINRYSCDCKPGFVADVSNGCTDVNECDSDPCQNEGACRNKENKFTCDCMLGYDGIFCENNINECTNTPCQNNATCKDHTGWFECVCAPGFMGTQCETNINECVPSPCLNAEHCRDLVADYKCQCLAGYSGKECHIDIDECESSPCQNDATCNNIINRYTCTCKEGYEGVLCETNTDECISQPCQNNGTCNDGVAMYNCSCTNPWMGSHCEKEYDACIFNPCENGATCKSELGVRSYNCTCLPGFIGFDCQTNIDDCVGHTCAAYEECIDAIQNYSCQCPLGYNGAQCDNNINECENNSCKNNATCIDNIGNYTCQCTGDWYDMQNYTRIPNYKFWSGYVGALCEIPTNACNNDPKVCLHGAICSHDNLTVPDFKCYCSSGGGNFHIGTFCEKTFQHCELERDQPACHNGGTCFNEEKDYRCGCQPGFSDVRLEYGDKNRCRMNIDECASTPCQNNATCIDGIAAYDCLCLPGFTGTNCEIDIEECTSSPCQNGGRCVDAVNKYICDCQDTGFEGFNCEFNINDCQTNPCQHGGSCEDIIKGYNCKCYEGYSGTDCEVDLDECVSNPCQYGMCMQWSADTKQDFSYATAAGYDCHCRPGYNGTLCDAEIDECVQNPCLDHGACQDRINDYYCLCTAGYEGKNCNNETNECDAWKPCQNGAACVDKLNAYECQCLPVLNGVSYGGVNCTVLHTGCDENLCLNDAECFPYLVHEENGIHNYTCRCQAGFSGYYCQVGTTVTFNGTGWLEHSVNMKFSQLSVEFGFRTTLENSVLFHISDSTKTNRIFLYLSGPRVVTLYVKLGDTSSWSVTGTAGRDLNDATWHSIKVFVKDSVIHVRLNAADSDCSNEPCDSPRNITEKIDPEFSTVLFGGLRQNNEKNAAPALVGCIRDMMAAGEYILPSSYVDNPSMSLGVTLDCPRSEQCEPTPCKHEGTCVDLWDKFRCLCPRPYIGETCENSVTPVTFGYRTSTSFAAFTISQSLWSELVKQNIISFFFRTRQSNGFMAFLGSTATGTENFLSAEMHDGHVLIRFMFQSVATDNNGLLIDKRRYDDGQKHFLFVNRTDNKLIVKVDEDDIQSTHISVTSFYPNLMQFGESPVDQNQRRRRRQVNEASVGQNFKGIFQDARLNDLRILLSNSSDFTSDVQVLSSVNLSNVAEGEKDDDLCQTAVLCEQNATCTSVFFNDYKCDCPKGFKGKNCSELNFCIYNTCPINSTCNDLLDGHECTSPATFNGQTSMLRFTTGFSMTPTMSTGITMVVRTRQYKGVLLHVRGTGQFSTNYLTLQLSNQYGLNIRYNLGQWHTDNIHSNLSNLADGLWHNISVNVQQEEVVLSVDSIEYPSKRRTVNIPLSTLVNGTSDIFIGGVPEVYATSHRLMFSESASIVKGCLDEVRINDVLLPYFNLADGYNSSASEQFVLLTKKDLEIGCISDPVCNENLCTNAAECINVWNAYTCNCVLGFNGTYCGNNIDDCASHGCMNGATCVDQIANYTCDCVPGYIHDRCQTDNNECETEPCQNNGTCWDKINEYECNCTANFTGVNCQHRITETCTNGTEAPCENGVCQNITKDGLETFKCLCRPGYTGELCESEIDYCESDPCEKGKGNCISNINITDYECYCKPGFAGKNCSADINECNSGPCQNGGTCNDYVNGYNCTCPEGWNGDHCEEDINECNFTQQLCGVGQCINEPGGYRCDCAGTGYNGDRCQNETNECLEDNPCENGATCINKNATYDCNCTVGYNGKNCTEPNCTNVCTHGGECNITDDNKWKCTCLEFHEGIQCDQRGPCADIPCNNGGNCTQTGNDTFGWNSTCICPPGWQGDNCSTDIDECLDSPCKNGATCVNTEGSFTCTCAPGYTGPYCGVDINWCSDTDCQNGGTCIDYVEKYTCECAPGYTGDNCETNINECIDDEPCVNGECEDKEPGYLCHCGKGFMGPICNHTDPCAPHQPLLCLNEGNCTSEFNKTIGAPTYHCLCHDGFTGNDCDLKTGGSGDGDAVPVHLIVGLSIFALLLLGLIAVISFMLVAKNKRENGGTYSPSRQEMSGSRVEMGNVLKPPPEERLI